MLVAERRAHNILHDAVINMDKHSTKILIFVVSVKTKKGNKSLS